MRLPRYLSFEIPPCRPNTPSFYQTNLATAIQYRLGETVSATSTTEISLTPVWCESTNGPFNEHFLPLMGSVSFNKSIMPYTAVMLTCSRAVTSHSQWAVPGASHRGQLGRHRGDHRAQ